EQFSCPSCPKTFGRLWHLKRHMATHLAVRPYECPYCGYRVNFKDKLKLHLIKVHPNLPPINLNAMDAPFSIVKTK
ncbi:Zinc finger C2H2-type, partial [Trinorchestia longiramus]